MTVSVSKSATTNSPASTWPWVRKTFGPSSSLRPGLARIASRGVCP